MPCIPVLVDFCMGLLSIGGMSLIVAGVTGFWKTLWFILTAGYCLTGGSGVLSDTALIDEQFRKAWLPFFCRTGRGVADPSVLVVWMGGVGWS